MNVKPLFKLMVEKKASDLFFIWNKLETLDSEGEAFFDSESHTLYLWAPGGGSPAGREVEIRSGASVLRYQGGLDRRDPGPGIPNVANDDPIQVGEAFLPVVVVPHQFHVASRDPILELERSGSDGPPIERIL